MTTQVASASSGSQAAAAVPGRDPLKPSWVRGMLMADDAKIPRRPLHDELAGLIRTMIVDGELTPGQRIPEQKLCTRFGVSRTPLREALKVLSVERLVRLLPNRGSIVVRITHKEADDLIAVLGLFEAFAGEQACARIGDREIAEIRAMHDQMVEHFRRAEKLHYVQLNRAIHEAIIKAAGNETLSEVHHMLYARLSSVLSVAREPPPRWNDAVDDHNRMMSALEARDGAAFALIAHGHMQHMIEIVHEALDKLEPKPRPATPRLSERRGKS
jgi:DNA-binding GntR family transcriptional regulator